MSLTNFFYPDSVAVIGASREKEKVGHQVLASIIEGGYEGDVFPVNPGAEELEGLKCYPSVGEIDSTPDLAVIVLPAKLVPSVMEQCARQRIKAAVIISAGFKEVGDEGQRLEKQVVKIARRGNMRIIGPNCLGLLVPGHKFNASFGGELPEPGEIAYISQSGALLTSILDMAKSNDVGFSKLVSVGNKADVDELDILESFGSDSETQVIAGYLESIDDGNSFARLSEKISVEKPILLIKSGRTASGAKAASSHTGSLSGSETAYECLFKRSGVIRCNSIIEQFALAQVFAYQPLPQGERVAVITNAGGPGIMATDAVEEQGLTFAQLSQKTMDALRSELPSASNVNNPVDVLGDALSDRYHFALKTLLGDPGVDTVVVLLTPQSMTDCEGTAKAIADASQSVPEKPIFACFMGGDKVSKAVDLLRKARIPNFDSPLGAISAAKTVVDYVRWKQRPQRVVKLFPVHRNKVEKIINRYQRRKQREISEMDSKEILEAYGFVTPKGSIATTAEQAANMADQIGYPVVLKIWSPDILHKSDVGGVKLGLVNRQQVMDAFDLMMLRVPRKEPEAQIRGVLVQEMCREGREVILGMQRDPNFGPLMMFGMGGIFVEVMKDVAFYLAPLTAEEARMMLKSTRTFQMLKGARGEEAVDINAIAEGLQRLSQLATEFPQIEELDINPYVVMREGVTPIAVDARMSVNVEGDK